MYRTQYVIFMETTKNCFGIVLYIVEGISYQNSKKCF